MRRWVCLVLIWAGLSWGEGRVLSQPPAYNLDRFYYYPYYYFPHNYWPTMSPRWPEPPGMPYQKPPAYMSYPAFLEPNWRFELWQPQRYYKGFHFWLDQF